MIKTIPRLRMFAGPNGSGKSIFKSVIRPELLGIYINPDEIEKTIEEQTFLNFQDYGTQTTDREISSFFSDSSLLKKADLLGEAKSLRYLNGKLMFHEVEVNSYFASVVADFIRNKLLEAGRSFTFETVMSSPDKIELLRKAKAKGYRTYLYYIATEHPDINISRVQHRVKMGGHPVPEDKIVSRYARSLDLLMEAVRSIDRAYIFDNSCEEHVWLAEITAGKVLEMKQNEIPTWFKKALWDKFSVLANHV